MALFELINAKGEVFTIEGEFVLGRESGATLKLEDAQASRKHASIYVADQNLMVRDEDSANGTYVNGQRIYQPAALGDGDELRIGTTRFTVRIKEAEDVLPTVMIAGSTPSLPLEAGEASGSGQKPKPKPRFGLLAIGCGVLLAAAVCAGIGLVLLGTGPLQDLLAKLDLFSGSSGLSYSLEEVLQEETGDDRPGVISYLGVPDAFTISSIMLEGIPVRVETWRYYGFGTRVDFVDGEATWTMDIEPAPEDSIMPAWYDPLAFQLGMTAGEAASLVAEASPAGQSPELIELDGGGEDLTGGIMLVGDQILIGLDGSGVVYVETIALLPDEEGG
jgi:pSer/pThr/pTyr-binding forkhead associated (FHA) protein